MTDCQLTDEMAGVDNAGLHENDVARVEIDGLENDGQVDHGKKAIKLR